MPRYEMRCPACTETFLVSRPVAARDEPAPCPACGAPAERLLSVPVIAHKAPRQADGALAVPRTVPRPRTYAEGHAHGPDGRHLPPTSPAAETPTAAEVAAARRPLPPDRSTPASRDD